MSLREIAAADLRGIVENADDFGWPITVIKPDGEERDMVGLSTDIGQTIDPETGIAVVGRKASVALTLVSLETFGMPVAIASSASKPWRVRFHDIGGCEAREYKVSDTMPDRALGVVTLMLEAYKP